MNLPVKLRHVMVLTGEPSGDFHGARLIHQIRSIDPNIYFSGIGGPDLKSENVDLFYNIDQLSAMGLVEVLMQFSKIKEAFGVFRQKLKTHTPDLLILIDYPGFNLKAAKFAKEHYNLKILYYITPKVWAWKKSRIWQIKKYADHCALILPFEEKIFKKARIPSTYVGNPLVDEYPEHMSKLFGRSQNISTSKKTVVIGLLPGSRKAEINNILPVMLETAQILHQKVFDIKFIISQSASIDQSHMDPFLEKLPEPHIFKIQKGPVKNIFNQADLVIAASGTVTLEAALCCVPTILVYKVSPATYKIARFFVRLKYVGLANLIVNKEIMPEFLQNDATPQNISAKAVQMLDNLNHFQTLLHSVRIFLGEKGASMKTAKIAVNLLQNR
ncbi:MAG: lipid-A-disaccharide synthase [Proteobacteria bacterium]|nr:lipid-A-disaccharide synthase [Pseudomonadota bacterium]MBU1389592.1 lipid-A-disaccharide synthase [Pseudomonadota bacterium]MBU1544456.1 lipid-A-disaccharide synthase [Pseudomonadota bacterium]MBU2429794.1 lipid-A-disaccharide synthase [Pseudomonadota bacterium]MBU2481010.1 lipid-A-disaccharide synthase [Pseudomonadota bacterium]